MKPEPLANALAAVSAAAWVICSLAMLLLPELSLLVIKTWFMGLQGISLSEWQFSLQSFIGGGASLVISAWIFGYALGWLYQKASK